MCQYPDSTNPKLVKKYEIAAEPLEGLRSPALVSLLFIFCWQSPDSVDKPTLVPPIRRVEDFT